MAQTEWRVEAYRDMDVYVLVTQQHESDDGVVSVGSSSTYWGYEVRVGQEGADPADAGDMELLVSGTQHFATRHAAEVAAFSAGYALVDRIIGSAR
ncbi:MULTISPECIES: hypothetical protein [Cupriavidus]|uniref:Uncharacterized protein n=1 Tax=Cupriavidus pinatubonensis (strain JMP 134 / LMG 1197) TaxID=264198 RepID=Q46YF2_CUPPJ|nr:MULTISPECIES: hypothetical protein [Cupriavidus]QYY30692.1 hypothetical protein K2O51_25545 [Cupriavidus pinatubonensis]TPQ39864.1 hypothetical protein C2U69_11145 [Cupriavidus pinatubonensis]